MQNEFVTLPPAQVPEFNIDEIQLQIEGVKEIFSTLSTTINEGMAANIDVQ